MPRVRSLVPATTRAAVQDEDRDWVRHLLADWMANVAERTIVGYRRDCRAFAVFLLGPDATAEDALAILLKGTEGDAHRLVLAYKAHMRKTEVWRSQKSRESGSPPDRIGLAPRTINRRLAALRSVVRLARVGWKLDIPAIKVTAVKDTTGVTREEYLAMATALRIEIDEADNPSRGRLRGLRDLAILHVWHDMALRREEVRGLDLSQLDLVSRTVIIHGKARTEPEPFPVPGPTAKVLTEYLGARGMVEGPLFFSLSNRRRRSRLVSTSYNKILVRIAELADIGHANPHGLRHRAITRALDRTNGNIRLVQQFSRHKSPTTVMVYDQARGEVPREIGEMVAEDDD